MFNTPCWPFPCFSMFGMCSSTPCCRLQVASRRTWLLPPWYTDKSVWNVSSIPNYLSFKHIPHKPTKESGSNDNNEWLRSLILFTNTTINYRKIISVLHSAAIFFIWPHYEERGGHFVLFSFGWSCFIMILSLVFVFFCKKCQIGSQSCQYFLRQVPKYVNLIPTNPKC